MTRFLHWRKMTWAIVLWIAAMAVLAVVGGLGPTAIVSVLGLIALTMTWFMTRPLWRMGHGARLRRLQPVTIAFKSVEGLTASSR
jgi:hypothetical protein